jgi:hypothetical protein
MRTPLLTETKVALEAALFYIRDNEGVVDLMEEALRLLEAAIETVNGAKEDAHRMEGHVNIDTDLMDELA